MALTITIDGKTRTGTGRTRAAINGVRRILGRLNSTARQSQALGNLRKIPLTVAAAGCFDAAGYTWHLWAGLLATAASLLYIESAISDE